MPNPGDFDPAEAIRQHRAAEEARKQREETEKERVQAQEDLRRANMLKLLRYADKQLEDIRNPIVSEFVLSETWWKRRIFGNARLQRRQKARYYGSWLALRISHSRSGLVKLRQPRSGYAFVSMDNDRDPRNVGYLDIVLSNEYGARVNSILRGTFRVVASLEEVTESIGTAGSELMFNRYTPVEDLAKYVTQALDFVATGQPPEPEYIPHD